DASGIPKPVGAGPGKERPAGVGPHGPSGHCARFGQVYDGLRQNARGGKPEDASRLAEGAAPRRAFLCR
ncbi:hypothetical protein HMPREF9440_00826, partial [Sutterella parvirubra YIT 11816]